MKKKRKNKDILDGSDRVKIQMMMKNYKLKNMFKN